MSIKNKIIGSFAILLLLSIVSSLLISYNLNKVESNVKALTNKSFSGIAFLLEADRDSYQSNVALLQIINIDDKDAIEKTIKNGVSNNIKQVEQRFGKFKKLLLNDLQSQSGEFDNFDKYYAQTKQNTNKLISLVRNNQKDLAREFYFGTYLGQYESMRDTMDFFTNETYKIVEKYKSGTYALVESSFTIFVIVALLSIVLTIFLSIFLGKNINDSILKLQSGLLDFFKYVNKETSTVSTIDGLSGEIGKMAEVVNENITKAQIGIEEDKKFIDEIQNVVNEVKNGILTHRINNNVSNKSLEELKAVFNDMMESLNKNIGNDLNHTLEILSNFEKQNFVNQITDTSKLSQALLGVQNLITQMLVESKTNGMTLENSSTELLNSMTSLTDNTTDAAASLEQTAAALEEITSNISSTTKNINQMSGYASNLTNSSKDGQQLASETTEAMNDIDSEVNAINEAISVIDQISFQTNILSLNAAVEAATAGEAGKGFAVVAQEVRNLASRSADAANEIKTLVENATQKANSGKKIANKMIDGYAGLNENISKTIDLIKDVEIASNEQLKGIEQINDAVNSLDHKTQQNANIAAQTETVAKDTDRIAKLIVASTDEKSFVGKDSISVQKSSSSRATTTSKPATKSVVKSESKVQREVTQPKVVRKETPIKPITSDTNDDEWTSF